MTQICFNYRFIVVFFPIDYCPVYNTGPTLLTQFPVMCPLDRVRAHEFGPMKFTSVSLS